MTDARSGRLRAPLALLAAGMLPRLARAAESPSAWPTRPLRLIAP